MPAGAKAIIAPHAGFRYSAPYAAYAYAPLASPPPAPASVAAGAGGSGGVAPASAAAAPASAVTRVVMLGPSHHKFIDGVAVSGAHTFETPVGNLRVDVSALRDVVGKTRCAVLTQSVDEEEHSLEMQAPFVARALQRRAGGGGGEDALAGVSVVPILVGRLTGKLPLAAVVDALLPLLADPATLVVISSDFCHWGERFDFTNYDAGAVAAKGRAGIIADGIEAMDRRGMALIEARDGAGFARYLAETGNTICGRNPIEVLLHALATMDPSGSRLVPRFLAYGQSSRVRAASDSSVSYAAAVVAAA